MHPTLIPPAELLRTAFHQYRLHFRYILTLFAVPFVLYVLMVLSSLGAYRPALSLLGGLIGLAAALSSLLAGLGFVAALAMGNMGESVTDTFRRGYALFFPFILVIVLTLFIFLGAFSLLIIPGVILSVLLSQATFTLVVDGKRDFSALLASWQLVRNYFWAVVGRLAILWVVSILAAGILVVILSLLGLSPSLSLGVQSLSELARAQFSGRVLPAIIIINAFKLFVLTPFSILFLFELYKSLRANTADLPKLTEESLKKRRTLLITCGVLGIFVLLVFLVFSRVLFNYSIQALELSGGPTRDFVQTLTELRSLSPQQIQTRFTR